MMRMTMTPQIRQVQECSACGQYIDPAPAGTIPRDPLTGRVHTITCVELGICPVCLTQTPADRLDDGQLARILLYLQTARMKRAKRARP